MEKVIEIQTRNHSNRRIFHAKIQRVSTVLATSQRETPKQHMECNAQLAYSSNTTNKHNENPVPQQQKQQQLKHRLKSTIQKQQQYYAHNAATAAIQQQQNNQQQQLQQTQQLTPTVDYFRFSALYALVATSATTATYNMREAYECVAAYDPNRDGVATGDNINDDYTTHNHYNRQRCTMQHDTRILDLKRNHKSLTQPQQQNEQQEQQLSKFLRTTYLRHGSSGIRHNTNARGVGSCGLYSASSFGTVTSGSGTTNVVGGLGLDTRSIFYLTLVFFIYCTVMMRASVAATAIANATMHNNNNVNNNNNTNNNNNNNNNNNSNLVYDTPTLVMDVTTLLPTADEANVGEASKLSKVMMIDKSMVGLVANASVVTPPMPINAFTTASTPVSNLTTAFVPSSLSPTPANAMADVTMNANDDSFAYIQRVVKRDTAHVPEDDDDSAYRDDEFDEYEALINNRSAKGKYIGAPCFNDMTCETSLIHVICDKETKICGCERNYPVQLGLTKGCDKPKKLGEQCFYDETCMYSDENSLCVQVRHNAMCQCAHGFHSVSHTKPTRRVFCTKDLKELNSDLPTLLGVSTGIAVLAGLICMVLHLFSKTKYPRPRNFGDANLPPPIMYSSETGIPLTVQSGRPSSRSSLRSSGSIGSYGNRRASSGGATAGGHGVIGNIGGGGGGGSSGTKGILVSTSRTGAARSAAILLISCHLTELAKEAALRTTTSRQTSGAGCSANSRDNLDENGSGGGTTACGTTGGSGSRSCDSTLSMTRHLQKQLNHQRHLLSLELSPAKTKNNDRIRTLLGINGIDNYRTDDDDELNSLDHNHLQIGALPTPASETPRFAAHNHTPVHIAVDITTQLVSRKRYCNELVLNDEYFT
ncbi:unnamed protein product [Ceratitis capitata]|uniref:(Mediterranean fruit fly) hypothetical protein n=2 Tax=Ceratitis capitata TaxID=7213 RepID=A0A811V5J6_CERCA|nr:unnamed protein product [Ceratitis capitata]